MFSFFMNTSGNMSRVCVSRCHVSPAAFSPAVVINIETLLNLIICISINFNVALVHFSTGAPQSDFRKS